MKNYVKIFIFYFMLQIYNIETEAIYFKTIRVDF